MEQWGIFETQKRERRRNPQDKTRGTKWVGLSMTGTYVLLGGRASGRWQDLKSGNHVEHRRRLYLGPSRHACTLMGHRSSRATGTWRNCVSWVLRASGLLSIDQHSKNLFDVLLRSRGGLPIIMTKYIFCGSVWWQLKLRQKLTQKMWHFFNILLYRQDFCLLHLY